MAVRPDGRANPNQLIINEDNKGGIAELREGLIRARRPLGDRAADGASSAFNSRTQAGFAGRTTKSDWSRALRIVIRSWIANSASSDDVVLSDSDVERLIEAYVGAAKLAADAGADFVDIKHCHGYLLHEFLGAHTRPGKFGGSFENRTCILRDIIDGIRASGNKIDIGVRLSAFDFVPFRPDPARSVPGKRPGIPEDFAHCLPLQIWIRGEPSESSRV